LKKGFVEPEEHFQGEWVLS